MTTRRIQMEPNVHSEDIITSDGQYLGRFIAGHGYWVTDLNLPTVEKVLADGRAKEVDPSNNPFTKAGLNIGSGPGQVSGSITIGKKVK